MLTWRLSASRFQSIDMPNVSAGLDADLVIKRVTFALVGEFFATSIHHLYGGIAYQTPERLWMALGWAILAHGREFKADYVPTPMAA